jgi:L-amino acid N-acyltransferase
LQEVEIPSVLREAEEGDLPGIVAIYNEAVTTSTATFQHNVQTVESRRAWFNQHGKEYPLIVAISNQAVLGYCSLSQFQTNSGYRKTGELSVYVEKRQRRKGIATMLM